MIKPILLKGEIKFRKLNVILVTFVILALQALILLYSSSDVLKIISDKSDVLSLLIGYLRRGQLC